MAMRINLIRVCSLLLIIIALSISSEGQNDLLEEYSSNQISLTVYVDKAGKALVTGYVEDISGLDFLNSSHYQYKNETRQLYALTNSLTAKNGDDWALRFASSGYYDEYHARILLPGEIRLKKINCSVGLEYIVYTSNESFVAEILGYDLNDPVTLLEYQMPLEEALGSSEAPSSYPSFLPIVMIAILCIFAMAIWSRHAIKMRPSKVPTKAPANSLAEPDSHVEAFKPKAPQAEEGSMPNEPSKNDNESYEDASECDEPSMQAQADRESENVKLTQPSQGLSAAVPKGKIVISREMAAVMGVLTTRERRVLEALIEHGGRMTQVEIRYETETPGSSLTGIIASLERRKIVTKKECGRTNVIELSEWFLSKKEDS